MIRSIEESPLYFIVNPGCIAFFAASNNFLRMGSMIFSSMQALGYEGRIYPVHQKEKKYAGIKLTPALWTCQRFRIWRLLFCRRR
jgi:acyl-CoA synthetase (NDP forming)